MLHDTSASETRELIDGIVSEAVRQFCQDGTDAAVRWLNSRAGVDGEKLKELIGNYRRETDECARERLYAAIEEARSESHLELA